MIVILWSILSFQTGPFGPCWAEEQKLREVAVGEEWICCSFWMNDSHSTGLRFFHADCRIKPPYVIAGPPPTLPPKFHFCYEVALFSNFMVADTDCWCTSVSPCRRMATGFPLIRTDVTIRAYNDWPVLGQDYIIQIAVQKQQTWGIQYTTVLESSRIF